MLYSEKNLDSPIHSTTVGLTSFFQFPLIPSDNQVNKCSLSLISQPIYVIYLFIYLFISSRGFESYKVSSFVHANSISNHSSICKMPLSYCESGILQIRFELIGRFISNHRYWQSRVTWH